MEFKLVTLDLDGTMFMGNSVLYLKERFGLNDELAEQHAKYARGEISEPELNYLQIPLIMGIELTRVLEVLARGPLLGNIAEGLEVLRKNGLRVAMLTFNPLQLMFDREFQVNCSICKTVEISSDRIVRINDIPENKFDYLKKYCEENNLRLDQCVHVGDSQNDVATFRSVGLSIALNSTVDSVRSVATISMFTDDFSSVSHKILEMIELSRPGITETPSLE